MKKVTYEKRVRIANDVMNYIYKYIDTNINIDELSLELNISKFHLHRIFKDEFGKNIYESIKSIRLEKAANLLITNKYSTITDISKIVGTQTIWPSHAFTLGQLTHHDLASVRI